MPGRRLYHLLFCTALSAGIAASVESACAWEGKAVPTATTETQPGEIKATPLSAERYKVYGKTAVQMAQYHWLDKAAQGNPALIAAITARKKSAVILAQHPRIAEIADADHYLCRRLTKWKKAASVLVRNPHVDHVIALDPEGIYRAIKRNPKLAKDLAQNPNFDQMITDNPELANVIAKHM